MNSPKLRFKEFTYPYKFEMTGGYFKHIRNGFVGTATPYYTDKSGIKYLQSNNIKNGTINEKTMVYINEEFHKKNSKSTLKTNDILMVQSGHAGDCAVVSSKYDGCNCHALIVMTPKPEINSTYYMYYLHSPSGLLQVKKLITGNTIKHILASDVKKIIFPIPDIEEQTKIANFLSSFDKKIQLQQEKIDLLRKQKKGYMQKIFSQELRFKDENGKEYSDWKLVKLKDISTSINYGMNASAKEFDGENIYIRITDIDDSSRTFKENNKVSPDAILDEKYRLQEGDILFARTGASVGKSFLHSDDSRPFYFAGFLIRIRLKNHINSTFVYQNTLTTTYNQWVKTMSMRSGQPGINGEEYGSFYFKLPCIEEQTKIANLLSMLDKRVIHEEKKLQKLQEQKKSLMKQLFI